MFQNTTWGSLIILSPQLPRDNQEPKQGPCLLQEACIIVMGSPSCGPSHLSSKPHPTTHLGNIKGNWVGERMLPFSPLAHSLLSVVKDGAWGPWHMSILLFQVHKQLSRRMVAHHGNSNSKLFVRLLHLKEVCLKCFPDSFHIAGCVPEALTWSLPRVLPYHAYFLLLWIPHLNKQCSLSTTLFLPGYHLHTSA